MAVLSVRDVSIGFRGPPLLDEVSCEIESGQKIGLLGRNGAGKTTFMRILCGDVAPDSGSIALAPGTTLSLLPQDVPRELRGSIRQVTSSGLHTPDSAGEATSEAWQSQHAVDRILSRMQLDGDARVETLSSGMKRRVLLARALVAEPDVLLLDEPTNHLDVEAITWLEAFLSKWPSTFIFVTHDRMFLRNLATRILEIDRGRLFDWSCDYDTFLARKEAALAEETKQNSLFDKRLAEEEQWIRKGIKARRTRNEGRVRALERMRLEHSQRRKKTGTVNLKIDSGLRSGNLVADVKDVSFSFEDRSIVEHFSVRILRGDKVGIIGPNGVGKTTLLRLLLGEIAPQSGSVRTGTNLQVAYFDQLREQLEENETVQHNVSDGYDNVQVGGRSQHVLGYLQSFLFTPERARTLVRFLSGGERNRILLAKMFAKPANTIVLDEPTNDLDAETLELLEQRLVEFEGTVLLVSHDREFLNNVVASTIVFEHGTVKEYDGGYDDWLRQRAPLSSNQPQANQPPSRRTTPSVKKKLSYRQKQELEQLPGQIEALEAGIEQLHTDMAKPDFFQRSSERIAAEQRRLKELESQLGKAYARWEQLE